MTTEPAGSGQLAIGIARNTIATTGNSRDFYAPKSALLIPSFFQATVRHRMFRRTLALALVATWAVSMDHGMALEVNIQARNIGI